MNDGCVNDCTTVHDESRGVQPLFHVIKDLVHDVMLLQHVAKIKKCRGVGRLFSEEVDLQAAFHGVAIVDGILDSLVRETEQFCMRYMRSIVSSGISFLHAFSGRRTVQ